MNIKLVRLSTGEDLMGDVTLNENSDAVIENPCMVYVRPNQNNSGASVGITRWMPYADNKEFTIAGKFIVTVADPAQDLKTEYNKIFGSCLVVAPAGLKLN